MATAELADNASSEEIQDFVKNLIAEDLAAPTELEKQTEAQTTTSAPSEEPPTNETTKPSTDVDLASVAEEEPAVEEDGEEPPETDQQDWFDNDEVRGLVSAIGISDEQLASFSSREELNRALMLLDHGVMQAGRQAAKQTPQEQQEQVPEGRQEAEPEGFDLGLDPEEYGEEVVGQLGKLQQHFEERISRIEQAGQQQVAQAFNRQFDAVVDTLGHKDLFGETGKETSQQMDNRRTLRSEWKFYSAGRERHELATTLDNPLLSRVMQFAFAEHISKQQRKNLTQKITRQSQMRMGGSVTKPTDPKQSFEEKMDDLYDKLDRENG